MTRWRWFCRYTRLSALLPAVAFLHLCPAPSRAVVRVPGDQPTISAALATVVPPDTVLIAPGTYTEDIVMPSDVTLLADGPPGSVTISGTGASSVIFCEFTSQVTRVLGIDIEGGGGTTDGSLRLGGGILVRSGALVLRDVRVAGNRADFGGGVFLEDATLSWTRGSLESNDGNYGGGIFARRGELHLSSLTVTANHAYRGGALYATDVELANLGTSQWRDNQATDSGGALHLETTAAIVGFCRFEGNQAGSTGGAVHADQGCVVNVSNSVFFDNGASLSGGSVWVTCEGSAGAQCSSLHLTHVDLFSNRAPLAAAGGVSGAATLTIAASAVAANESVPACLDTRATLAIECTALHENGADGGNTCEAEISDTLHVDPYLCDLAAGDLSRCSNSPLLTPPACAGPQLGATGLGCAACGPTQAVGTSWGRVKAFYR
jgi:predicted outer membrane repeat protein